MVVWWLGRSLASVGVGGGAYCGSAKATRERRVGNPLKKEPHNARAFRVGGCPWLLSAAAVYGAASSVAALWLPMSALGLTVASVLQSWPRLFGLSG